jgi:hypothetical protein
MRLPPFMFQQDTPSTVWKGMFPLDKRHLKLPVPPSLRSGMPLLAVGLILTFLLSLASSNVTQLLDSWDATKLADPQPVALGSQSVHAALPPPLFAVYLPAGQSVHRADPAEPEYLPAVHAAHPLVFAVTVVP